jgi:hypothetical protein
MGSGLSTRKFVAAAQNKHATNRRAPLRQTVGQSPLAIHEVTHFAKSSQLEDALRTATAATIFPMTL